MIGMEVDSLDEPVSEASIYHQMVLARYGGYYPTSKRNSDSSARASKCWPHALVGRREQPLPVWRNTRVFLGDKICVLRTPSEKLRTRSVRSPGKKKENVTPSQPTGKSLRPGGPGAGG